MYQNDGHGVFLLEKFFNPCSFGACPASVGIHVGMIRCSLKLFTHGTVKTLSQRAACSFRVSQLHNMKKKSL